MTTPDALRDAEYIADVSNVPYDDGDDDVLSDQTRTTRSSDTKGIRARAKVVLLERLLRDFDILIYCQLSLLYYMEYAAHSLPLSLSLHTLATKG